MTRLLPALTATLLCGSISAVATSPHYFWRTNPPQSRTSTPLDITPGGALPAAPAFIHGRLKCAENVNRYLARIGVKGTGTARARDFLAWGRPSGIQPGAVQVEARGRNPHAGHVRIVSHRRSDGVWMCKNPSSSRQQWTTTVCNNGRVLAYRMPADGITAPQRVMTAKARPAKPVSIASAPSLSGAPILPAAMTAANWSAAW